MNAETAAIARRLVACKRWEWLWLPGMADVRGRRVIRTDEDGTPSAWCVTGIDGFPRMLTGFGTPAWAFSEWDGAVPDLDDELTRAGVLPVVRLALGVPTLTTIALGVSDPEWDGSIYEWRLAGIPDSMPELWRVRGASEIEVLCLAMEAAQQ